MRCAWYVRNSDNKPWNYLEISCVVTVVPIENYTYIHNNRIIT